MILSAVHIQPFDIISDFVFSEGRLVGVEVGGGDGKWGGGLAWMWMGVEGPARVPGCCHLDFLYADMTLSPSVIFFIGQR